MEPLQLELTVACSPEHALSVWVEKTSHWWPHDHSVSGVRGLTVSFEPRPGGRIYERASDGTQHEWGEVLVWERPHRLVYLWHIASDRSDATEVAVTFDGDDASTTVRIVHSGWERLGTSAADRRARNQAGWAGLLPHYQDACRALSG